MTSSNTQVCGELYITIPVDCAFLTVLLIPMNLVSDSDLTGLTHSDAMVARPIEATLAEL
jgi:hypothetical protein